jgi:predicted anti-sigma-YlaC factor YlaD
MRMSKKLHYSLIEWRAYRDNLVDDNESEKMQNHLLGCDECMENYLTLMEAFEETAQHSPVLDGFTERVMEIIYEENRYERAFRLKNARARLITYYVSAACVTLLLVSSGVFTLMFNGFAKFDTQISMVSSRTESIFTSGWTDKLVDSTSEILNISQKK